MENIIIFVLSYVFILLIYEVFIVNKAKKYRDDESKKKPIEVRFLVKRYGIDIDKINYNQMLQLIALISSFDIAVVAAIISTFEGILMEIFVGLIIIVPVTLVSYSFIGKKYRKKMKK